MEYKALSLELKSDGRTIDGYGSVFGNVDEYGDIIEPGAFAASIAKRRPKMLWQHRMDKPIGVWDDVAEDGTGLRLRGRVANTPQGDEALALVGMGAIDGLSIGFQAITKEMVRNNRVLKTVDLWEVSFVTIPANELATITGVKAFGDERAFEGMLHEQGFSRTEAKIVTARGYKGLVESLREAGGGDPDAIQREAVAVKDKLQQLLKGLRHA